MQVASFHQFDTVVDITVVAAKLPQLSVDYCCSPFTSPNENKIKYWDASTLGTQYPHRLTQSLPETIQDFRAMPHLPAVFRTKRAHRLLSNSSSNRSGEPVGASNRQSTLQVIPGGTPSWATQPWHYVFQVSASLRIRDNY